MNESNVSMPLFKMENMSTTSPTDFLYNVSDVEYETTTFCLNAYCVSEEEYIDMILDYIKPTVFEYCLIVTYVIVFITGLVGNFLVCFAVWRNHSMRNVTNYFIGKSEDIDIYAKCYINTE